MRISEFDDKIVNRTRGFLSEFWKFAAKGNVFDLAVGVVLGTAFSQVVNALVTDIITPFLALLTHDVNFSTWAYTIRDPIVLNGTTTPALAISYGHLLQVSLNFLIVGFSIFVFYKLFSKLRKRLERHEAQEPVVPISTQEKLLCEIRDLLKDKARDDESKNV